jgi:Kef-type K+ transport system membrane component KefB
MNLTNTSTTTTTIVFPPLPFPFYDEATTALLFLSIYLFEQLFSKSFKTSPLLGHLLAGVLLGPACFNIISHHITLRFIGKLGVMLLVVESGLATDVRRVFEFGTRSFFAAFAGTISPVLFAVVGGALFFQADVRVGLAAGSAIAPTSLGFAAKILGPEGLQTQLGAVIAISAVVDDVLSLCLLEIVRVLATAQSTWDYIRPVVASLGSILVGLLVVLGMRKLNVIRYTAECARRIHSDGVVHDFVYLLLLLLISISLGWGCASVGSSDLLGCFLAGLAFSDSAETKHAFEKHLAKLTKVGTSLFFACTVGFGVPSLIDGSGLFSSAAVSRGAMLLVAALVGKAFPLGFFAVPLSTLTFFKFAIAMQGRGEFSFLIADTAKVEGVLNDSWHAGCIWAVFVASFLAPFAFRYVLHRENLDNNVVTQAKNIDIDMKVTKITRRNEENIELDNM